MQITKLLALILTIYGTLSFAIPIENRGESKYNLDGCARIYESYQAFLKEDTSTVDIKYNDVKDCYLSFPFDLNRATKIIESLKGIYEEFYIFLDQSKEKAQDGFDFRSVDLITELDTLLKKEYTTDFEFFSIKVYHDDQEPSNVGCEVTHIDGYPALEAITDFAKNKIQESRDLGVRFNMALASLQFNNSKYSINNGKFALRSTLPEAEYVTYDLKCSDTKVTKKLIRPWKITAHNHNYKNFYNFTDSKSYYESICLMNNFVQSIPSINVRLLNSSTENSRPADIKIPIIGENITYVGDFAMFLRIDELGVVVIPTFKSKSNVSYLITEVAAKFDSFAKSGVKKIVFDFTNNGGGLVLLSQYFNKLISSHEKAAFPRDFKINNVTTFLINQADHLNHDQLDYFDPKESLSFATYVPFKNSEDFIGNNLYTRGGITSRYSNRFNPVYDNSSLLTFVSNWKFPWSNKDVVILTNGNCGSSCAQTAQFLAEQSNFTTISVGGFFNHSMSYSSFPGGNIEEVDNFYHGINSIATANTTNNYPEIPNNIATNISMNAFTLTFSESYSIEFPNSVMEFMYRPATYRLYYDGKNIFNPSLLWLQAAKFIS
ncbi:peptidase s41 family protein [Gigaspora margarita]|uniref:Peptidase s41 family protein n=1 Tax=Gigaspora margarita TaxID=4874 RepID=A0A8H4EM48_GIGMA|nr:peptidase s41 family protein [Gigaspora margarita]